MGRWSEVAGEDRICLLCKKDMGDERHFLTSCEALTDERFDLKQLMKNEDDNFELNDVMKRVHEKSIARIGTRGIEELNCCELHVLFIDCCMCTFGSSLLQHNNNNNNIMHMH